MSAAKNKCASVFRTARTPYYSRCVVEAEEHGIMHADQQWRLWVGEFETNYASGDAVKLPFYFEVTTDVRGTKWKCVDVALQRVIARSPERYATIAEAHEAIKVFQTIVRG